MFFPLASFIYSAEGENILINLSNRNGFTLIELLIVVAILGVLAMVAIPQFASYRIKSFNSNATSDLRNFRTAMDACYADRRGYPGGM
jgi:type IV pilus assembly protein PilA